MIDCQVKGCKGKMICIIKAGLVRCECDRCGTIMYQTSNTPSDWYPYREDK